MVSSTERSALHFEEESNMRRYLGGTTRLAVVLAKLGRAVQVRILDRARNLVGTEIFAAS